MTLKRTPLAGQVTPVTPQKFRPRTATPPTAPPPATPPAIVTGQKLVLPPAPPAVEAVTARTAPPPKPPATDRIVASYKDLSAAAGELKSATTELANTIAQLEKPLHKLGIAVPVWFPVAKGGEGNGDYWSRDIGFTSFSGEWCIALRRTWGNEYAEDHNDDLYRFHDAPYWMQIESVAKIPDLFEELLKRAKDTTQKVKKRTAEAQELAAALASAVAELNGQAQ